MTIRGSVMGTSLFLLLGLGSVGCDDSKKSDGIVDCFDVVYQTTELTKADESRGYGDPTYPMSENIKVRLVGYGMFSNGGLYRVWNGPVFSQWHMTDVIKAFGLLKLKRCGNFRSDPLFVHE